MGPVAARHKETPARVSTTHGPFSGASQLADIVAFDQITSNEDRNCAFWAGSERSSYRRLPKKGRPSERSMRRASRTDWPFPSCLGTSLT